MANVQFELATVFWNNFWLQITLTALEQFIKHWKPYAVDQYKPGFHFFLYTMEISTKFEDIPYIRLGGDTDLRFKFPKLQVMNLKLFWRMNARFRSLTSKGIK